MANRFNIRSLLNDNFKILTCVLILFIAITPNFIFMQTARASTSLGGWTITQQITQGASTALTATKTTIINGANVLKTSTAKITPNATQVAKVLRGVAAGYALSFAVEQLIGSVDWVLDPANNQIRYTDPNAFNSCTVSNDCGGVDYYLFRRTPTVTTYYTSAEPACSAVATSYSQTLVSIDKSYDSQSRVNRATCRTKRSDGSPDQWGLDVIVNPAYAPNATDEDRVKTLPLDTVAQKVISNAETGDTNAQVATTTAAQDMLANDSATQSDVQTQLNTNSKTQSSEAASAETIPKDPAAPEAGSDISISFPVFCSWAPLLCETAQTALDFMTDFSPDQESSQVTIQQDNNIIFDDSQRINFSDSCPAPEQFTVSLFGYSQNLEFSYQPLCEFMSMIKLFVIAGSYLIGAYIVMGLSRGSAE